MIGPVPAGADPDTYDRMRRRVLWSMPSGLYVLGTRADGRRNLMTINWVTQLSLEPKLVGVAVEGSALSHALLVAGGVFALSFVPRAERAVVRRFVKPVTEAHIDEGAGRGTMQGEAVRLATTGAPVLEMAVAWIDCEVRTRVDLGGHSLFVGEIVDCAFGPVGPPAPGERLEVLRMEDTRM
ncbi:MAG TPA: flavin reductase family protein, partial [Acidimicrobiales bacterium]|nr:flavin reductase family protein [Acidimicrobiales bacterium]